MIFTTFFLFSIAHNFKICIKQGCHFSTNFYFLVWVCGWVGGGFLISLQCLLKQRKKLHWSVTNILPCISRIPRVIFCQNRLITNLVKQSREKPAKFVDCSQNKSCEFRWKKTPNAHGINWYSSFCREFHLTLVRKTLEFRQTIMRKCL